MDVPMRVIASLRNRRRTIRALPWALLASLSVAAGCAGPDVSRFDRMSEPDRRLFDAGADAGSIRQALNAGADPNVRIDRVIARSSASYATLSSPIHVHVCRDVTPNSLDVVGALLRAGADPNQPRGARGAGQRPTALHLALECNGDDANLLELIVALLEGGANPNAVEQQDGTTPLGQAIADLSDDDTRLAAVVSTLLEAGADPDKHEWNGDTPLHKLMCAHGPPALSKAEIAGRSIPKTISALLEGGADPNAEKEFSRIYDSGERVHLHFDEAGNRLEINADSPYHYEDFHSGPPLSFACDPAAARLLIDAGADVGKAMDVAIRLERSHVVAGLREAGVDPSPRDEE